MNWTKKQISIVIIVAVSSFMGTFLISAVNIALPTIEKSFNLNAVSLSWVVTSFLLSTAMFLLPVGKWGDINGVQRIFKIGISIFSITSLLSGIATTGFMFILYRFLQGIGAAFTSTSGMAILVSSFAPQYRGRVLGISVSAVYLGLASGPFFGGYLTQVLGWQSLFYFSALLGLIISILSFIYFEKDVQKGYTFKLVDWKGSVFYMLGLCVLSYGSSKFPELTGLIIMLTGILFLLFFWYFESKSESPLIETKLFTQNRLFAFSNMAALINYSATFSIIFLISLYLQKIKGLSPRDAGTVLVAQPVVMTLFSPLTGRLSDRVQPRYLSTIGMTICTIGLVLFSLLTESTPIVYILIILMWVGLGFALFSSPNMNTIMGSVNKNQYGLASGTASTMRVVGQIISMTISTFFFAVMFKNKTLNTISNPIFLQTVKYTFISLSMLSISGIYFSFKRGKIIR